MQTRAAQAQHEREIEQAREAEGLLAEWERSQQQPQPANSYSMEGASGAVVDWWKAARNRLDQHQQEPSPKNAWLEAMRARQQVEHTPPKRGEDRWEQEPAKLTPEQEAEQDKATRLAREKAEQMREWVERNRERAREMDRENDGGREFEP